jgi:hypothetical protein
MFQANSAPDWTDMSQFENPPPRLGTDVLGWQPGWMVNDPLEKFDPWPLLTADLPAAEPWEAHGRFVLFWVGNFGLLPFFAAVAAWLLLARIRGGQISGWWALLAGAAFILVTPMLGQMPRYQTDSVHGWLLGRQISGVAANLALLGVGIASVLGWLYAERRQRLTPALRGCLLFVAAILFVDGMLATAKAFIPSVPLLPADTIPLLAGTAAFVVLLRALSRRWQPETWQAALLFPGLYLFFLCCNVKFAPSAWDNTKLMIWAYLLALPPIWELLLARCHWITRGLALFALFFSGFVTLLGGLNSQHEGHAIAFVSELEAVREATAGIPITETFAAEPTYNQPLLLVGRKVALGYLSHLWSHGIDYTEQERHLDALMNGSKDWRLHAARLGTRYLFFGRREAAQWPDSLQAWRSGAALVAEGKDWALFDLETPPLPVAP